ncbi:beta-ketoacyl-[acyl-carrier-protein] synthase family protein [Mucilaginibacter sp. dw_454]|uniref:beta-ketoacyl-[acyl-carrier-protein] synthase family protein n=1 Tax=Mucilaginibacter sp. dw_454 TaxID=2720079 RepID=UPI001BD69159|nr:beta-ketoacyl-[acyl-carrier-protein] synthase family protein [Mucilaginibacter sp. dw_454]
MNTAVFVVGMGAISGIGNNVAECLAALTNGGMGIDKIKHLPTNHSELLPSAEVKLSNYDLSVISGLSPSISRTAMLSMIAAQEAWDDADIKHIPGLRTGFVSASTAGGIDKTENFAVDFLTDTRKGKLRDVINHDSGSITNIVADKLGIKHHISTVSTACSSSANAIIYGARLIKHNIVDVVVAGGTDSLNRFTLNGFNTLMVLDEQLCKPFDENRKGLNLGEGAGYLVLTSARVVSLLKKAPYCALSGYFNANDAYHQTSTSPNGDGPYRAMSGALAAAGLQPEDIDYINLHGTGTQNNDISEGAAIERLFQSHYPKMSSTKSFTGHTLGASAGIEAVFSTLAIQHGVVFSNLRLQKPMTAFSFAPETVLSRSPDIRNVLSNSIGFGGNCSSLVFSKV